MKKCILLILCIVSCVLFTEIRAQNDKEAERYVKEAVSQLKKSAYKGNFTILYYNAQSETTNKQSGEIEMKGNKFRMNIGGNEIKFDGKTQWVFVSDYNEVSITIPTEEELQEVNPLAMVEYYVSKDRISYGENGEINLYPIQPDESDYFRIRLSFDKSNLPTQLVVYQKNGDRITLCWDSLIKTKLDDSYFVFDPTRYPNVQLNDLR